MMKYDSFVNETNDKFIDYENAIAEIEKNIPIDITEQTSREENTEIVIQENIQNITTSENDIKYVIEEKSENNSTTNFDLKNLVEKEFESNSSNS